MELAMTGKKGWARYKLPILLAFVAVGLYAFSILWIVYGRGGAA